MPRSGCWQFAARFQLDQLQPNYRQSPTCSLLKLFYKISFPFQQEGISSSCFFISSICSIFTFYNDEIVLFVCRFHPSLFSFNFLFVCPHQNVLKSFIETAATATPYLSPIKGRQQPHSKRHPLGVPVIIPSRVFILLY